MLENSGWSKHSLSRRSIVKMVSQCSQFAQIVYILQCSLSAFFYSCIKHVCEHCAMSIFVHVYILYILLNSMLWLTVLSVLKFIYLPSNVKR